MKWGRSLEGEGRTVKQRPSNEARRDALITGGNGRVCEKRVSVNRCEPLCYTPQSESIIKHHATVEGLIEDDMLSVAYTEKSSGIGMRNVEDEKDYSNEVFLFLRSFVCLPKL